MSKVKTSAIKTFAEHILTFYKGLQITTKIPAGVEVMNPYQDDESFKYCSAFYTKYYSDHNPRTMILGINPGRHGGGITGIPFTDPIKLEHACQIPNPFQKKPELSADFIYAMIAHCGGTETFYSKFYFSAVSPLGFTKDGKNLNYYDIKELQETLKPFIIDTLNQQLNFGVNREVCYCLGEGENYKFLTRLNAELKIFMSIVPLAHPRFIMQYRRKKLGEYLDDYKGKLV